MTLRDCTTSGLHLCRIPRSRVAWVTSITDRPSTYFEKCGGSALFVPSSSMPRVEVDEYDTVEGTRIENYSPALDVLLWQFGRDWMGHVQENYALLAAPDEDVFYVLNGDIYLIQSSDEMVQGLPDDCNVNFRSFPLHERKAFESLLLFLRQIEVVIMYDVKSPAQSFIEQYSIPIRRSAHQREHWGRGDSLLKIEQLPDGSPMIRLATVFSVLSGFDMDDD